MTIKEKILHILLFQRIKDRRTQIVVGYLKRLYVGILLLLLTLTTGIVGYIVIENYTFIEAFYMTIITLASVGFMEVRPLSDVGRIFTAILIITNLGVFAYSISVLSGFLVEGNFRKLWEHYTMLKKITELEDHVIVCGYGRYGREICEYFLHHKLPFVVIERAEAIIEELKLADITFIQEDATHDEALEEAGIHKARALIACLPDDVANLFVVLSARQMNPTIKIISRASSAKSETKLRLAGANEVITPETIGGFYMASLTTKPDVVEFFRIISNETHHSISFEQLSFDRFSNKNMPKTLRELDIAARTGANLVGVKMPDGRYIINPSLDLILESDMCLIALGTPNQIAALQKYCHTTTGKHPSTKLRF